MMPNGSTRAPEIDSLRGLAITLVVGAHVVLGSIDSGAVPADHPLAIGYDWTHPFRVASMVLVAGLFIDGALRKHTPWRYLASRGIVFGWLYVVWFSIQTAAEIATNPWRNHRITSWTDAVDVWNPPAQLYFFPTLWVCTVLVVLARGIPFLGGRPWVLVLVAGTLAIALWGWAPPIIGLQWVSLVVFLAIGHAVGLRRFVVFLRQPTALWVALGVASVVLYTMIEPTTIAGPNASSSIPVFERLGELVASSIGVVVLCAVAVLVARTPVAGTVAGYVGVRSSAVFLGHIVVGAGTRIALAALGLPAVPSIVCAWALGVVVPLVVLGHAGRLRCKWLFEPPAFLLQQRPRVARRPVLVAD